ncbi:MAG: hypothetical protein Fur0032_21860 [Terrimicrobiaceae bacterium]
MKNPKEGRATGNHRAFRVQSQPVSGDAAVREHPTEGIPGTSTDDLPRSYGAETIFLIAQEPHWLFTYWDIPISRHPGGPTYLRVMRQSGDIEAEIEVAFETRNWYVPVKVAGAAYFVEIGYYRGGEWVPLAKSSPASTPPDQLSDSRDFQYATIPLHMSFHRLLSEVQGALEKGESLSAALARFQKAGGWFGQAMDDPSAWGAAERKILEALFGGGFLEELSSMSSADIPLRIRKALEEKLSSAGASEFLSSFQAAAGESSLFSALAWLSGASAPTSMGGESLSSGALASSWGGATSWSAAALSSWVVTALSSWVLAVKAGASWGGETGGLAGESGSWAGGVSSSWGREQMSSWLHAAQSSWLKAAQASWSEAALSSWNAAAFSSWAESAASSWAGGSESLSSPAGQRGFFMHVNAEVIFYGGTDPRARVTVDGHPVALSPDGTFRYHFVFPDGDYEIPIVAISPDGVETRSATLRFERNTAKAGQVDDTAQPPLGAPMGGRS